MKRYRISKKMTVNKTDSIYKVIKKINESSLYFQLVVEKGKLLGTVSDGDIRRALLLGLSLNDEIKNSMNDKPIVGYTKNQSNFRSLMKTISSARKFLPIVDHNKNLKYLILEEEIIINKVALIMAGGFGKRLGKITKKTPKPLLKVANKPMLELIIRKLEKSNYSTIYISTHYLHEKIKEFIEKRSSKVNIKILFEKNPLGTAGSIHKLSKVEFSHLTVINGDIVSDLDFDSLSSFHTEKNNDITLTVANYSHQVPFGVVKFDENHNFKSLFEKPFHSHFILSGIYCLSKKVCNLVGKKQMDMPFLINKANNLKKKIGIYPIYEYWRDVGNRSDFELVNKEKK